VAADERDPRDNGSGAVRAGWRVGSALAGRAWAESKGRPVGRLAAHAGKRVSYYR
jgi:hypothetical protein